MREMTDKVKRGESLYGTSTLTPYMQGVASRNSRYSGVWLHILPWFNFANHDQVKIPFPRMVIPMADQSQHGVDTAKYYQQAERELAAEQAGQARKT